MPSSSVHSARLIDGVSHLVIVGVDLPGSPVKSKESVDINGDHSAEQRAKLVVLSITFLRTK